VILEHGRQLDWRAVERAADLIKRACNDACYTAPEDVILARELVVRVCTQLDAITKALLITPPGSCR
jgi:hypothetical protein